VDLKSRQGDLYKFVPQNDVEEIVGEDFEMLVGEPEGELDDEVSVVSGGYLS